MKSFLRAGGRLPAGVVASALLFALYAQGGVAWPLGFVVLVPWLHALDAAPTVGAAVRGGLGMTVAFAAAVLWWFGNAIAGYVGLPEAGGIAIVLAASPLLQPQFLAFALARHLAARRHGAVVRALVGAAAWVATEWLWPKLLGDTLGHGLAPSATLRQAADLGGAAGLTCLLILANEAVAHAWARRGEGVRAVARPLALALAVPLAMAGYGAWRLSTLQARVADAPTLRMGLVQSNIVDYERLRREHGAYAVVRGVLDTHYLMSREAVIDHHVDALLWSETVYPTTFGTPKSADGEALDDEIRSFALAAGVPLVFGTYDRDAAGEYNAAAFVDARGATQGLYRKTRLFLLTEYVPPWLDGPTFRRLLPWTGTWRPGNGARVFPLRLRDGRELPVAPLICLDDVDPGLATDAARQGAQALLTLSNDAWFTGHPAGARLHLAVATFRSLETRLPQLRVTNNGISATIDATGDVRVRTGMGERRLLIGEVTAPPPPRTLMVAWGDWVGRVAAIGLLLFAAWSGVRAWRRRRALRMTATPSAGTSAETGFEAEVPVLTPVARAVAAALRLCAGVGLLWLGLRWLSGDLEAGSLAQLRWFVALVIAPSLAAWAIARAGAARVRVQADALVLDLRDRRVEIPVSRLAALQPWRWPLPAPGASLRLASGQTWPQGLAGIDASRLAQALVRAGAPATLADAGASRAAAYAQAWAGVRRRWFDRPLVKFGLFPLLPALPAFRLHQIIAYGGTFGEYYTFGLKAWLLALAIWWASWAVGMTLYAAALRVPIELGTWAAVWLRPRRAAGVRRALVIAGRLLYYVGGPLTLLLRVLQA